MQAGKAHETRDIIMAWNMLAKIYLLNLECVNLLSK